MCLNTISFTGAACRLHPVAWYFLTAPHRYGPPKMQGCDDFDVVTDFPTSKYSLNDEYECGHGTRKYEKIQTSRERENELLEVVSKERLDRLLFFIKYVHRRKK